MDLLDHIHVYSIHKLLCTLLEIYIDIRMPSNVIIQIQYNIIGILMNLSGSEAGRNMLLSIQLVPILESDTDTASEEPILNTISNSASNTVELLNNSKLIYLLYKLLKKTSFKNASKFDISILTCQVGDATVIIL